MKNKNLTISLIVATLLTSYNIVNATEQQVIQTNTYDKNISNKIFNDLNIKEANGGAIENNGQIVTIDKSNFTNNSATSKTGYILEFNEGYTYNSETQELMKDGKVISQGVIQGISPDNSVEEEWDIGYSKEYNDNNGTTYKFIKVGTARKIGEGGAIYSSKDSSIGKISNSNFQNNVASTHGGAIYVHDGELQIIASSFKNNTVKGVNKNILSLSSGGAIHNNSGDLDIKESEFIENNAYNENLYEYSNNGTRTIHESIGGAIYTDGNTIIENSKFERNKAAMGGAIYADENSTSYESSKNNSLVINNSSFSNNEATFVDTTKETINGEDYEYTNIGDGSYDGNGGYKINDFYNGEGGAISTRNKQTSIKNSSFIENKSSYGGAISSYSDKLDILNSNFVSNSAKWNFKGNYYDEKNKQEIEIDQWQGAGGAVTASNNININSSSFENNSSGNDGGGAIYLSYVDSASIDNSTFNSNSTLGSGGAILYSEKGTGSLNIKDSNFTGNSSKTGGGAITNNTSIYVYINPNETNSEPQTSEYNSMNIDSSIFRNNSSLATGGAIDIYTENSASSTSIYLPSLNSKNNGIISNSVNISDSTFENNTSNGGGGAISSQDSNLIIKNSQFNNNSSYYVEQDDIPSISSPVAFSSNDNLNCNGCGGAVLSKGWGNVLNLGTQTSTTTIESSKFNSNNANNGGAIANIFNGQVTVKNSEFNNNSAQDSGGAISNGIYAWNNDSLKVESTKFNSNSANNGGAIYHGATTLRVIDSDFTDNTAEKGGAIYLNGSSTANISTDGDENETTTETINYSKANILAKNKDVTFSGNTAEKGRDIYINNGIVNLNATEGRKISFDGGISGVNATINVNDPSVYENLTSTGTVIVDNFVTPDENSTMAVNVNAGSLKLTRDNYLNGVDLSLADSSTLDMMNGEVGTLELNSLTSNNGNIKLDTDFGNSGQIFDFIDTNTDSKGTLNITALNMLSDMPDNMYDPLVINIHDDLDIADTLSLVTADDGVSSITNDYLYTTKSDGNNITISRLKDADGVPVELDGFTLSVNQEATVNGTPVTLSEDRTFTANKDITITGKNIDEGWTGDLGGENLTVNGNGYTLNGNNKAGINITDGKTLSFVDTNISGFKTSEDRKGALNINDGGVVNITASQKDITLGGTTADKEENANIVYLDGTTAKAYFTTENNKSITVNDPMRSSNNSNEVYLKGNGKITFNKLVDPVTIYNENEDTVHNNYIDGVVYNLNNGKVSFTKDEYLNGQGNPNTLNFNGGTLDIANDSVGTVSLNELNLNANSNIMVDVDLANKQMDRLTAKTYNLNDNYLNVSKMNMLSDSDSLITKLLFADDKLKNNVTTSVSSVAYSPIYKYGVEYDKTTGNFVFTRGGGSGGTGYDAYNPAVLASPVAAQMGGYMGMLDTYANSFTHMDMNMLKPLNVRMAELNANKYAIAETTNGNNTAYLSNEMNSGGMWFKPYMSYDSVRLKNGPKVNSTSYGSFIGGDSGVKSLGGGFYGVLSPYIAYNGSHQSYSGNSIYQNGGTLGLTGTLYKGNFFTGLTVGTGASGAESSTMYGHDDFGMFMAGVASKTGYNFEFKDGRYIIQPSVQLSYTMVDTFNYTNGAGVSIHSDPLHALQISPNLKFVMNTKNGWQPYLTAGMNWNLIDETKVSANMTSLPDMSVKPYVQYGVGVQKTMKDRLTGFLQVLIRNGGRNGIAANGGFRYMFGKETKNKTERM